MRLSRIPAVLALALFAWLLVFTPIAAAQSLWSQNKPEQAAAARLVIEDNVKAMQTTRDAAIAKGDMQAAERWDKAIAIATGAAKVAKGVETGNVADEDAGLMAVLSMIPPQYALIGPLALWAWREWKNTRALKAVKEAEAIAIKNGDAAKKDAENNAAAAKSIVNMVDAIRIADPTVAETMKKLSSDANTDFTKKLTPLAKEIVAAERLT